MGGVSVAASVGGVTVGRGTTSGGGGGGAGVAPAGPAPSIGGAKQSMAPSEPLFHSPPVARQQVFFNSRSLSGSDSFMSSRHSSYDPISQLGAAHAVAGATTALPPSAPVAAKRTAGTRGRRLMGIVTFICRPFAGLAWRPSPRGQKFRHRTLRWCSCHDAGVELCVATWGNCLNSPSHGRVRFRCGVRLTPQVIAVPAHQRELPT